MLKIIGYVVLGLTVLISIGATIIVGKFNKRYFGERPNHLSYVHDTTAINFQWAEGNYDGHFEPHVALVIHATIEGIPRKFSLQFDTGHPNTVIYEKPLNALLANGLAANIMGEKGQKMVQGLELTLGGNKVTIASAQIFENYGKPINWEDTTTIIALGTIGADFIDGKVTAIDFKNKRINLYPDRPEWMAALPAFEAFEFNGRRIMLPSTIDGRKRLLLYDSGCSSFGLLTSKHRFNKYSDRKEPEIALDGSRWGESLPIHHKATKTRITLGGADLPLRRISYVDMYANLQRFMTPFTRIGGWLGNKPFIERTLILDTKRNEFIVIDVNRFNTITQTSTAEYDAALPYVAHQPPGKK